MHPIVTIYCAFTRRWSVERWLSNLEQVTHEASLTNLCFIVDGNEHWIANTLKKFAEEKGYRSFHVKVNENWHPNETKLAIRRMRVADVKNQSKDLIARTDGDIIIGFEDDTVFDRLTTFDTLILPLDDPKVGFVEGAQMGRWGAKIIGAWKADDPFEPKQIETLVPAEPHLDGSNIQEITGGGFYGYATRRNLYLNHEYYTSSAQPWGPDVNYGFWLNQRGYKCLIDWNLMLGHEDFNKTLYPDQEPRLAKVVYNKNESTGKWDRTDYEQDRY